MHRMMCLWTWLTLAFICVSNTQAGITPVYRLFCEVEGISFYTADEAEVAEHLNNSWPTEAGAGLVWEDQGIAYDAMSDDEGPGGTPVYRFRSDTLLGYFYTISEAEKDHIINTFPDLWEYEGPVFYVFAPGQEPSDAFPVYRFWSPTYAQHFYTIDEEEKALFMSLPSEIWTYEAIAWYAYPHAGGSSGTQAAEQMAETIAFFDASVADETLTGKGPGESPSKRLDALRNMLAEAARLIDGGFSDEARDQLADAYKKCDGQSPPPDFVTGDAAAELAEMIQSVIAALGG